MSIEAALAELEAENARLRWLLTYYADWIERLYGDLPRDRPPGPPIMLVECMRQSVAPDRPAAQPAAMRDPLIFAVQKIMARLADLLDDDQFNNIERIVLDAGVPYPPLRAADNQPATTSPAAEP